MEAKPIQETAQKPKTETPKVEGQKSEQPAPPQTEEPAPTRRTRGGKATGAGLSLKSLKEEKTTKPEAEIADLTPESELTEDFLRDKWKNLAESYAASPRLSSTISEAQLEFSDGGEGKVLTFKVINQAQKEWIESKKLYEMEGKFQQLTASKIHLKVDVVEETEMTGPKAYLPSEKAKDLMDKNDEVRNLVKDLELDIK